MFISILAWLVAFATAITVHEAAHAFTAVKLGDPTPKLMGRLSLNPLVHYDKVGTTLLLFLVILRAIGLPIIPFGWAKPVMFDPYNLKKPRRDAALISLAGPVSNILLAFVLSLFLRLPVHISGMATLYSFLVPIISLNVVLAVFNLLPIHPLDGGKILVGILPEKESVKVDMFLRRFGIFILVPLVFFSVDGVSPLDALLQPILGFFFGILIPGSQFI